MNGLPVVAYPHSVLVFKERKAVRTQVPEQITSLITDQSGTLWLQTRPGDGGAARLLRLQKRGFTEVPELQVPDGSLLYDSGNEAFFQVAKAKDGVKLFILRRDGVQVLLAPVQGTLHAISWNKAGMAAVVDTGLYIWKASSTDLTRLAADSGFVGARDVALIEPGRVVLALKNYVVLISNVGKTVVAGLPARCRFSQGVLYLLDEKGGFLWALRGTEKLASDDSDKEYARQLIQANPGNATESSSRYLEAVRLIGCVRAKSLRAEAVKNFSSPITVRGIRAGEPETVHELTEPGIISPKRSSPLTSTADNPSLDIKLELVIGADGAVRSGRVLREPKFGLGEAELERARQWRYQPALKDGRPVASRITESVPVESRAATEAATVPENAQKYFETGQALIHAGKYSEAVAAFDRAISVKPTFAEAYYEKALALVASSPIGPAGNISVRPGAVEALKKYLELSPAGEHAQSAEAMLKSLLTEKN